MAKLSWIGCLWMLGASCGSEGQSADHPLCRALTSERQKLPTRFPSAYSCFGEEDGSFCAPRTEIILGGTFRNSGMQKMGCKQRSTKATGSGNTTWWVYEDRRKHTSRRPGDLSVAIWIDCQGYYAFRGVGLDTSDGAGVSHSPFPGEKIKLAEASNTDVSWPSLKTSRGFRSSDKIETVFEEDIQGPNMLRSHAASPIEPGVEARRKLDQKRNGFVYAPDDNCPDFWSLWPAVNEKAIADGTFMIFDVFPSIGNLFLALQSLLQFVRLLELGLVITWSRFPGFREAFDPAEINWATDPAPFAQTIADINRGINPSGFHVMEFNDYSMVLSDPQLDLLASTLGVTDANREAVTTDFRGKLPKRFADLSKTFMNKPMSMYEALKTHPCAWNMLLRRSPAIMSSLEEHSPWGMVTGDAGLHHHPTEYVAWHIRTGEGESATSYDPTIHHHVLSEPSTAVCPAYLAAMEDVLGSTQDCSAPHDFQGDNSMVYISSNSKPMSNECTVEAATHGIMAGHIDLGLSANDAHTWFSTNPSLTALNAFLDYLFLMDSAAIVRTSSSFSGTVAKIKGMICRRKTYDILPGRLIYLCLPGDCRT